jgi:hypothetical protein
LDDNQEFEIFLRTPRTRGSAACRPLTSFQGDLFLTSRYDPFESAEPGDHNIEGEATQTEKDQKIKETSLNAKLEKMDS